MTDTDLYQPDPGPLRAAAEATELAQAVSGPVSIEGYRLAEGNLLAPLVVASESPFDTPGAVTRLREYDPATGQLVRVLVPERSVGLGRPGGLRFGPGGRLYCVGEDHVAAFGFRTGSFIGSVVQLTRLDGQALVLVP